MRNHSAAAAGALFVKHDALQMAVGTVMLIAVGVTLVVKAWFEFRRADGGLLAVRWTSVYRLWLLALAYPTAGFSGLLWCRPGDGAELAPLRVALNAAVWYYALDDMVARVVGAAVRNACDPRLAIGTLVTMMSVAQLTPAALNVLAWEMALPIVAAVMFVVLLPAAKCGFTPAAVTAAGVVLAGVLATLAEVLSPGFVGITSTGVTFLLMALAHAVLVAVHVFTEYVDAHRTSTEYVDAQRTASLGDHVAVRTDDLEGREQGTLVT